MFEINKNVISITRGDTGVFTLNIQQGDEAYDYSNDTVLFTVKKSVHTKDIVCQKQVRYGENIMIAHEDTANIPYGVYWYDVQLTTPLGIVDTVITPHRFWVKQEVTFDNGD